MLGICVFKRTNTKVFTYFNVSTVKYLDIYISTYLNIQTCKRLYV